ncbi:hypothetical protein A7M48_18880 [Acinetobacter baumannii]|nr:hypothetical protein A7M48_18880 [Acinetobacter baumannii]
MLSSFDDTINLRTTWDLAGNNVVLIPELYAMGIYIGNFKLFGLIINQSSSWFKSIWQLYFFMKSIPIIPSHGIGKFLSTK